MTNREQRRKERRGIKSYLKYFPIRLFEEPEPMAFSKERRSKKEKARELGISNKQLKKRLKRERREARERKRLRELNTPKKSNLILPPKSGLIIIPKGVRV